MKINCYLLNNNGLVGSDVTILLDSDSYWVESYSVVCEGRPKNIFPSTGRKYEAHISPGASGNSLLVSYPKFFVE